MTRVQKERFLDEEEFERVKDSFCVLDCRRMALGKPGMAVLHPLPRVNEILTEVDDDPRAAYFRQVENGKFVRMALICKLLEWKDDPEHQMPAAEESVADEGLRCGNVKCICNNEHVKPKLQGERGRHRALPLLRQQGQIKTICPSRPSDIPEAPTSRRDTSRPGEIEIGRRLLHSSAVFFYHLLYLAARHRAYHGVLKHSREVGRHIAVDEGGPVLALRCMSQPDGNGSPAQIRRIGDIGRIVVGNWPRLAPLWCRRPVPCPSRTAG